MKKALFVFIASLALFTPIQHTQAAYAVHSKGHLSGADTVKMLIGTLTHPFELLGNVIPIIIQPKENAPPDIRPYAAFLTNASPWAMPMVIQNNKINYTESNPLSGKYCAKLVIKPVAGITVPQPVVFSVTENTTEVSVNYEKSQQLMQGGETVAAAYGLLKKAAPSGQYDFNRPTHLISTISTADCAGGDPGTPQPTITQAVKDVAQFPGAENSGSANETIFTWIEKIIDGVLSRFKDFLEKSVPMYVDIWAKHGDGHVTNSWCWMGRCDPDATNEDDTTKLAEVNGSYTGGILPLSHTKKPIEFNAIADQMIELVGLVLPGAKKTTTTIPMAYKNANSGMEDQKTAACLFTPLSANKELAIGNKDAHVFFNTNCVSPTPTPPVKCPIDIIAANPAPGDTSCGLCGTDKFASSTYMTADEMAALPNGVPPLLNKVIAYVGGLYHVPGSVLLGTMLEEGAFSFAKTDKLIWPDDATVKTYSDCTKKDPMTMCRGIADRTSQGAAGPFGILPGWWEGVDDKYEIVKNDPLWKDVLKNRKPDTISECNFVDAAFFAAREIGEDASHKYVPDLPDSCTDGGVTYPMYTGNARPATCSEWGPDRVATTRYQYGDRAAVCGSGSLFRLEHAFSSFTCGK